jgi:mono/diheme cytochrome c family protein
MTQSHNHGTTEAATPTGPTSRLVGILAEFSSPDALVHACDQARQAGIRRMDAYSPFPVHGIDPAIGIRRTRLPFLVLAVGLSGLFLALGLQYTVNATDAIGPFPGYPFLISGKPLFSLPANIPVTFEVIVLSSAFATLFGSLALNGLPKFANPLHRIPRFKKATNNGFFLMIEADDPNYNPRQIRNQLEQWGAGAIEEVQLDLTDQKLPAFVKMVFVLLLALCTLPPALIYRARGDSNSLPRLHFNPDMDWQYKSQAQQIAPNIGLDEKNPDWVFADQRAMRGEVPGTVIRGQLRDDSAFFSGIATLATGTAGLNDERQYVSTSVAQDGSAPQDVAAAPPEPNWISSFPEQFEVNAETMARGKQRFDIYCAVCHGTTGAGDGMVNKRAMSLNALQKANWTSAKSLHDHTVINQPVGRIFDTISNGRGTMGPYKSQITVADRWAIVLYIKALQESMSDAVMQDDEGNWVPVRTVAPPAVAPAEATPTTTDANPSPSGGGGAPVGETGGNPSGGESAGISGGAE